MNLKKSLPGALIILVLALGISATTSDSIRKFDEFGDINCENEMAHLDNLAVQLQNEPAARAVIIFYGGRRFRGRLERRGEAAARAARLKPYLVQRRGIPTERVEVIDGGYTEEWHVEIWVLPATATSPLPNHAIAIPAREIKFRKGKVNPRDYRCQI